MKKYFKMNFSEVSNKRLREYEEMVKELSYFVRDEDPKEIWEVMYRVGVCIRQELHDREEERMLEEKKNKSRRKSVQKVSLGKKMIKHKMFIPKKWK